MNEIVEMKQFSLSFEFYVGIKKTQGNRGDMRKIPVTRQFFRLEALRFNFSKKGKKYIFSYNLGELVQKNQVSNVLRLVRGRETDKQKDTHMYKGK